MIAQTTGQGSVIWVTDACNATLLRRVIDDDRKIRKENSEEITFPVA